jgi:lipopolysaccharide transport system ATP-binding protein
MLALRECNNMNSKNIAIKAENICKRYRIGLKEQIHDTIGGTIFDFIKSPLKNYRKYRSLYRFEETNGYSDDVSADIIWALRGISFTVEKGEALGIIGRNGAGKSTLLKIFARITDPTTGRIEIHGRVSSLLEVGTGFHPELTGRENIYLNGTILGMRKREIDRKFDEIVDFSGVKKFIDTPVKRYSSGMRVRVAFAVAAFLEPEILIVDEVLAVGDEDFQKKCLGKMEDVAKEGRTVLFVTHNMSAITRLCNRAIWLADGEVKMCGTPLDIVSAYLSSGKRSLPYWKNQSAKSIDRGLQIKLVRILSSDNELTAVIAFNRQFMVEISYEVTSPMKNVIVLCRLIDSQGNIVFTSWDTDWDTGMTEWYSRIREPGFFVSTCKIPAQLIRPGRYQLSVGAALRSKFKVIDFHENVLAFDISGVGYPLNENRLGIITPLLDWEIKRTDDLAIDFVS